jgi:adenylate cyclase
MARRSSKLRGTNETLSTAVAIDLTGTQRTLVRNLLVATAFLLLGTAAAVVAGWRLASIMSGALARVGLALQKLEQQEYVHVDALRTGDELEDLADGFNAMVDGLQERDRIRATFGKYVTPHIVDFLLERRVELGGQTLQVTILFTDIRGFTGISERMDAQALVALLNEYFTEMVTIIIDEGGVVDKYIGDAIMAVFGAPIGKPDDAVRAVRAAVRMRAGLAALNDRLIARGQLPLSTGIGLHTGEVVAGNIGSEARMEYTVIGDAVNLAARLETSTKELGADILISDVTQALVAGVVEASRVGEISVKGRAQPVTVYSVTGLLA